MKCGIQNFSHAFGCCLGMLKLLSRRSRALHADFAAVKWTIKSQDYLIKT